MLFFTIVNGKALPGIPVFENKLGSKSYPLAEVALSEGLFPKVLTSPFYARDYFSIEKNIPDCFIDRGYFYQFNGIDHNGSTCKLIPVIIADQPYYTNRVMIMLALKKSQSIQHEHGTYSIWEHALPATIEKFSYIRLFAMERDDGWINIQEGNKKTSFCWLGNKFDIREF